MLFWNLFEEWRLPSSFGDAYAGIRNPPVSDTARNVVTYSAAISACEKAGQWQVALKLLELMVASHVQPNVISYNAVISACTQGSQWEQALNLFEPMSLNRVWPNNVSYNAAMSACGRAVNGNKHWL